MFSRQGANTCFFDDYPKQYKDVVAMFIQGHTKRAYRSVTEKWTRPYKDFTGGACLARGPRTDTIMGL